MCPVKIFISHSSSDKDIVKQFVEKVLLLGMGLDNKDVAFTSEEGFGVEPGENIARYIKENIYSSDVVLVMLSERYRESEICLIERGAVWALEKNCIPVLLPKTEVDKLGWLFSVDKAIKMTDKTQVLSLCQKIAGVLNVDLNQRFTIIAKKIDEFIAGITTIKQPIPPAIKKKWGYQ